MMDFLELAARRCSIRNFSDRQIEQDKMDRILEAARLAPTGANLQPQKIYVLQSEEAIKKIRELTECAFNAPTVLLVTYDKNKEWKNALEEGYSCGQQDASIVAAHMMLEACELGLSSCWVNVFPPTKLMQAFGLPDTERPVLIMPMGYAAEGAGPSPRHTIRNEINSFVTYL